MKCPPSCLRTLHINPWVLIRLSDSLARAGVLKHWHGSEWPGELIKAQRTRLAEGGQGLGLFSSCSPGDSDVHEGPRTESILQWSSNQAAHWSVPARCRNRQWCLDLLRLVWVRPELQKFQSFLGEFNVKQSLRATASSSKYIF